MRRRYLCSGEERIDLSKPYFAIEVLEDGLEINLSNNYEYCIDDGVWKKADYITNIQVNAGQTVYFRGNLVPLYYDGIGIFTISKKCNLSGNIMSLLFGDDFEGQTDLTGYNYAFYKLFYNCINIIDASQLILPATTLVSNCYSYMFSGCTSLTAAPALHATTLVDYCYSSMFQRCTSLVTAPELPATTLVNGCYSNMFYDCTKLNYIKALFTTEPSLSYTYYWVSGVLAAGTFVKSKDATWNVTGVNGIPERWTVQTV